MSLAAEPLIKSRARRRGRLGWAVAALVVGAILALPAIAVIAQSFQPSNGVWQHLIETVLPDYIVNSLALAAMVTAGTFVIGVGTAWLSVMADFPGRRWLSYALVLPLAAPSYVVAYAFSDLMNAAGPVQGALRHATGWQVGKYWFPDIHTLWGAAVVFILTHYPYVYLLARSAFLQQSAAALDVARTLGLGPWRVFFRVALPLARPAIAGGLALALMETLADFGAVSYLSVQTFTTGIYKAWFGMGERPAAGQLATILLAFVVLVLVFERYGRRGIAVHNSGNRTVSRRARLSPLAATGATIACLLPPLLGFVVPALALLRLLFVYSGPPLGERYIPAALTSVTLAALAAIIAVSLAVLLGYARRAAPGAATRAANGIAGYGYALPGSVIAVGILIPMTAFDRAVNSFMLQSFGVRPGLIVTGTIVGLLFAYTVRFIAPALSSVESGFQRITPSIAAAARTLSRGPVDALRRVHIPLIAPAALTAALIVFVDTMKELPATLLMRPMNSDTLAVLAYGYASDERLENAALPALTIVAVGLPALILMMRRIGTGR